MTLSGEVNDEIQRFEYADVRFRDEGGESFIARLWATRRSVIFWDRFGCMEKTMNWWTRSPS